MMEQVELIVSTAVKAVILAVVILATLAVAVHALTTLGLDERRAEELGVVLSMMAVVYLFLQVTLGGGQGARKSPPTQH
jgi:ABC-type Fe3+-siderophore transport system permease subunit